MYCTIDDIRAEGVDEVKMPDERAESLIGQACALIDRVTGMHFEPRRMTVRLDGNGGKFLPLPCPIVECHSVTVDGRLEPQRWYVVYSRIPPGPDDRDYPRLYHHGAGWPLGILNVEVDATWGYLDRAEDGTLKTPAPIRRAALKLALHHFPRLSDTAGAGERARAAALISETTDGHSYKLSEKLLESAAATTITGDSEIDDILSSYMKARVRMAIA